MKRALLCAPLLPEFDRESGSKRLFNTIVFLQEAGWAVSYIAQNGRAGERYVRLLQQRGVATYCGFGLDTEQLISAAMFDLAIFAFWHLAEKHIPTVRKLSPKTRILVDMIDLHFMRNARGIFQKSGATSGGLLDKKYADEMTRELNTYAAADGVLAVSQKEADLVNDLLGDPNLAFTAPDSEDLAASNVPRKERKGILFLGNFRHPPNVQGVEYLCKEVIPRIDPRVRAKHPVYVVGNGVNDQVRRCLDGLANVKLVGWVPSVVPYLEQSLVSVIPLLYGAGTKRKLIQALMVGTPTVSTSIGIEGLELESGNHVLVANEPDLFAKSITSLCTNRGLWERLARQGRLHIEARYSRAPARKRWLDEIEAVLKKRPKHATALQSDLKTGACLTPLQYQELTLKIQGLLKKLVPTGATVIVVSKGDEQLVKLDGLKGWHFPQNNDGVYAGHYPADDAGAIAHLEGLRAKGGQYFFLPCTAFWWLEHYREFKNYLETQCQKVFCDESVGLLYVLSD